jgi:hypothetical protein
VLDQITQHLADGPESLEQLEYQPYRTLSLLIGIKRHLA